MATRPTTAPIQNPNTDGFFPRITSQNSHDKPAAAAAVLVVANAYTPSEPAPTALPALKPNQPNQSKPVPINTYGILAGLDATVDFLGLRTKAPAKAAIPAEICTTVPPAKSRTPHLNIRPSGCQTICANGAYTRAPNKTINKV